MANDESYRDPTNLENKLQKHQEFEAEVNANETQIQNIAKVITITNNYHSQYKYASANIVLCTYIGLCIKITNYDIKDISIDSQNLV